jgi:UDP-N-acetylmuramate-alanine ligase
LENQKNAIIKLKILFIEWKTNFEIFDKKNNKNHKFKINLPGKHNVFNATASIGVAMEEGIPIRFYQERYFLFLRCRKKI